MTKERPGPSEWLLVALIASLPLMKPAIAYPIVLTDAVFSLLVLSLAIEVASGRRDVPWQPAFAVLGVYVLSFAPSLLATTDLGRSAFKLGAELYLAGLAAATIILVRSKAMLERVVRTWLAATAVLAILALLGLIAFWVAPDSALYAYGRYQFGTLPPGDYPRLSLTFFNANTACNYLTASLGLLFVAWQRGWVTKRHSWLLLAGILFAALATISPGLGGIALALGSGAWLISRSWVALASGIAIAIAFLLFAAFTPVVHSTAPYLIEVPGTELVLAPSGRFLTWTAALAEFLRHPLIGHGLGLDAVQVRYANPSGDIQQLTDAHNLILSIAAQTGAIGLAGLTVLIGYAARLIFSRGDGTTLAIGLTFLNAFLYQGLSGSFEDTRHLWVLFGLLVAAARLEVSRPDGSNRRAGAPSPC